jgi:1,2-diacylglycerol 3-beta-glucosyltransferase
LAVTLVISRLISFCIVILGGWLGFLLLLALISRGAVRRRPGSLTKSYHRLAIVIPAHDEESIIAQAIASIMNSDYPGELFKIFVVADNCTDMTAAVAIGAGAECFTRTNTQQLGKGYALQFGLNAILTNAPECDAIVFLDADSLLSPDFLQCMSHDLAAGHNIIQGCYTIADPERTWLTRLTYLSFVIKSLFQYPGLNWLGLSVPLRGSGMCFSRDVLEKHGWTSVSLTEDLEYSIMLIRKGYRIHYDPWAVTWQYMPPTLAAAKSQRLRWSIGEATAARGQLRALLKGCIKSADMKGVLQALYLLAPPFSSQFLMSLSLTLASVAGLLLDPGIDLWVPSLGVIVTVLHACYFLFGLTVTGFTREYLNALCMIPIYALWRIGIHTMARFYFSKKKHTWVKTSRI